MVVVIECIVLVLAAIEPAAMIAVVHPPTKNLLALLVAARCAPAGLEERLARRSGADPFFCFIRFRQDQECQYKKKGEEGRKKESVQDDRNPAGQTALSGVARLQIIVAFSQPSEILVRRDVPI